MLSGKPPGKAAVALMRSYAYLQGGGWGQALKDARVALVYSRQLSGGPGWPRAFAAVSSAIEGRQVPDPTPHLRAVASVPW